MTLPHPPFDGHIFGARQACFGCGPEHPHGFRLAFDRDGDDIVTRYTPGEHQQGAPGLMHGGLISTLADEVGVWALIGLLGRFGFTATFSSRFVAPVRIGVEVEARARIKSNRVRLVDVTAEIRQDNKLAYTSELTFVVLDRGGAERMIGGPIPDAWARFCR